MEIAELSAVQMREALAAGTLRSVEIVEALHARADAREGTVHAFTEQYRDAAIGRAREADVARERGASLGPLHGLPLSVKENFAMVGTPSTVGLKKRLADRADRNATVVEVALSAGAVVLGKTNVPQLLLSMETHNDLWGTTVNPHDATRVPGGSSGGEAAAIAAGMSVLGVGTDIGGSIRMPAAFCGIAGLKPTWGRWSMQGVAGGQPGQEAIKAVAGPMARTVDDLTLLMQALSPEAQHAHDPLVSALTLPDPGAVSLRGLVVGVYEEDDVIRPSASVRRAVREAAGALRDAGATVVPYTPPRSWEMFDTYFGLLSADGFRTALGLIGDEPVTPQLRTMARIATLPGAARQAIAAVAGRVGQPRLARLLRALGEKSVTRSWALVVQREALKRAELAAWSAQKIDLLVGPPTTTPAPHLGQTHDWSIGAWPTMRWNLLDHPAGVVPVSRVRADEQERAERADRVDQKAAAFEAGSAGLPVAAQVIGRPWEEHLVLAAMRAIEARVAYDASPRR